MVITMSKFDDAYTTAPWIFSQSVFIISHVTISFVPLCHVMQHDCMVDWMLPLFYSISKQMYGRVPYQEIIVYRVNRLCEKIFPIVYQ